MQVRGRDAEDGNGGAGADRDGIDSPAAQRPDPPTATDSPIRAGKILLNPKQYSSHLLGLGISYYSRYRLVRYRIRREIG